MNRVINGQQSTLPESQRCIFQGCTTVFPEANCANAKQFTCRMNHEHFEDLSGGDTLEKTGAHLIDTLDGLYGECINYVKFNQTTALPPLEACKLIDCRVSG